MLFKGLETTDNSPISEITGFVFTNVFEGRFCVSHLEKITVVDLGSIEFG